MAAGYRFVALAARCAALTAYDQLPETSTIPKRLRAAWDTFLSIDPRQVAGLRSRGYSWNQIRESWSGTISMFQTISGTWTGHSNGKSSACLDVAARQESS